MDEAGLKGKSVKELKAIIARAGLSHVDCCEKAELLARACEAVQREAVRGAGGGGGAGVASSTTLCSYECKVVDCEGAPEMAVLMLHGFGATNGDFVALPEAAHASGPLAGRRVRWIFPQASTGSQGVPEWWELRVQEWLMARMAGPAALAPLLRKMPPGLVEARQRLSQLLDEVAASSGLPHSKVVLGGFSQGAMTAIDVALSQPAEKRVAGVLSLSGAPIVVDEWAKRCTVHPKLPVFVSHGRADPVLPFEGAGWLVDLLGRNGLEVHTEFHDGAHTVGPVLPQAFKWLSHR